MVSPNVGKALVDSGVGLLEAVKLLLKEKGYEAIGYKPEAETTQRSPSTSPDLQPKPADPVHTEPVAKPANGPTKTESANRATKSAY